MCHSTKIEDGVEEKNHFFDTNIQTFFVEEL